VNGGWIRIETGGADGQPRLLIANSGPVIPEGIVEELFEPFRRLDGERTSDGRGLGLGLSIVRAIAVAHSAALEARPLADGGLEVEVRFAAAPTVMADDVGQRADAFSVHRAGIS
jgi:signal transduction histidine kinase